jgi:hypothetical protein
MTCFLLPGSSLSTAQATLILFNFSISLFLNRKDKEDFHFIAVMIYTDCFSPFQTNEFCLVAQHS